MKARSFVLDRLLFFLFFNKTPFLDYFGYQLSVPLKKLKSMDVVVNVNDCREFDEFVREHVFRGSGRDNDIETGRVTTEREEAIRGIAQCFVCSSVYCNVAMSVRRLKPPALRRTNHFQFKEEHKIPCCICKKLSSVIVYF